MRIYFIFNIYSQTKFYSLYYPIKHCGVSDRGHLHHNMTIISYYKQYPLPAQRKYMSAILK